MISHLVAVVIRFPFYYELKLLFVFWLVLPITKVSGDHNGTLLFSGHVSRAQDICIKNLFIHTLRNMSRWVGLCNVCRSCDDDVVCSILMHTLTRLERRDWKH